MCVQIPIISRFSSLPMITAKYVQTATAVQFRLVLDLDIAGLIGGRSASTEVTDGACPIELPTNSV